AFVIFRLREPEARELQFSSRGGALRVTRDGGRLCLDFPARPPAPREAPAGLAEALGRAPREVLAARDLMAVYEREDEVRGLRPALARIAALDNFAVVVTARGDNCDFVSRFFAPAQGVPEDPVTGSSHCTLVPYWSQRLGKTSLHARQVSP